MGTRENKVETYLHKEIEKLGGTTRKWECKNRAGVPDRLVFMRRVIWAVEVKTVDGKLSSAQIREHERLKSHGVNVRTVYGEAGVDDFIDEVKKTCGC